MQQLSRHADRIRGIIPTNLAAANAFVKAHHSYLPQARGCIFCAAAFEAQHLTAVVIVGRPISPSMADGVTAEITRLCTHQAPRNTASALIRRARDAAFAVGYHRLITYVDAEKSGSPFLAAAFQKIRSTRRVQWHGRDFCVPPNASPNVTLFALELPTYAAAKAAAAALQQPSNGADKKQMLLPVRYAEKEGDGVGVAAAAFECA